MKTPNLLRLDVGGPNTDLAGVLKALEVRIYFRRYKGRSIPLLHAYQERILCNTPEPGVRDDRSNHPSGRGRRWSGGNAPLQREAKQRPPVTLEF